jgi:hypothetical protein
VFVAVSDCGEFKYGARVVVVVLVVVVLLVVLVLVLVVDGAFVGAEPDSTT